MEATLTSKAQITRAKQVAAERETTVTGLVIEGLTRVTAGLEAYQLARERQMALMRSGHSLRERGEPMPDRGAAHER